MCETNTFVCRVCKVEKELKKYDFVKVNGKDYLRKQCRKCRSKYLVHFRERAKAKKVKMFEEKRKLLEEKEIEVEL